MLLKDRSQARHHEPLELYQVDQSCAVGAGDQLDSLGSVFGLARVYLAGYDSDAWPDDPREGQAWEAV